MSHWEDKEFDRRGGVPSKRGLSPILLVELQRVIDEHGKDSDEANALRYKMGIVLKGKRREAYE